MNKSISERVKIEELRKIEGYEHVSDEEAEIVLTALQVFSLITYRINQKRQQQELVKQIH